MRNAIGFLVAVLVAGCAAPQSSPKPASKTIDQLYLEAFERHYAGADKWTKGLIESDKCSRLVATNPQGVQPCLDQLPPAESFLPKDRKKDETIVEYMERKGDEWAETDCFYKGRMQARYIAEIQRIEDECKRDLEIKRLRKAVEKLQKQNPR